MSAVMAYVSHAYKKYGYDQRTHHSDLGADGDILVVPTDFYFGCPGEYFGLGSPIRNYNSQIFEATDGLQLLVVYGNISADAIGIICHQLGLLCTGLHAKHSEGLFKAIYQLDQLLLLSS